MAGNNSAVLDVVTENKEISALLKQTKDNDVSTVSLSNASTLENSSLVQSPSIESFSTIQDIENLSELNMEENSDLFVKIDNPQKHLDTLETYITFRITTKVARIEFSANEYVVRRRYNDFLWLRQKLNECHPFCIIPPLPAKHSLVGQLDRYSKDFIMMRMKALNVFISRIVKHPILSCNEQFKLFLTANQMDFSLHRRQKSISDKLKPASGNATYQTLKYRNHEFDKMKTYLNNLTEKLTTVERIANRINKEEQDLVLEMQFFYPIFTTWAATEPELNVLLQSTASALEKSTNAQNVLISAYPSIVGNPIKDFLTYIDVVQETLQKRESFQSVYEAAIEELSRKKTEKDKLLATTENHSSGFSLWKQPSVDDKLEKLGTIIPQLVKKVEMHQDNLECANEQLRSDLEQWQWEKQQYIKKMMLDFVNKQIEYYEKNVHAWEGVAAKLTANQQQSSK
ncbi:sorting nexin-7-like [Onthophagus taurus]|uniref:sorting nexin-7-like n=1 Tax=Onthophagus taurus TaxID=166361 RepID=UPI000C204B52|nr:sorting nexin-7-like [Onthophagus taurus]